VQELTGTQLEIQSSKQVRSECHRIGFASSDTSKGIELDAKATQPSYALPWYEWWPERPVYFGEDLQLNIGDTVFMNVTATGPTSGTM
jgi:hypothetical protein